MNCIMPKIKQNNKKCFVQGKNKTQYIRENTEEFGTFQKLFNMNQQKNINQWKDITTFNYLYKNIKISIKQRSDPRCPLMSKNAENLLVDSGSILS